MKTTIYATFAPDEVTKILALEVLRRRGVPYAGHASVDVLICASTEGEKRTINQYRVEVSFDPANNVINDL